MSRISRPSFSQTLTKSLALVAAFTLLVSTTPLVSAKAIIDDSGIGFLGLHRINARSRGRDLLMVFFPTWTSCVVRLMKLVAMAPARRGFRPRFHQPSEDGVADHKQRSLYAMLKSTSRL